MKEKGQLSVGPLLVRTEELEAIGGQGFNESAGSGTEGWAALWIDEGITEIQFVFGPGDRDVKETTFLVDISFLDGAPYWEEAVGQSDHEDNRELEAFGLMDGCQSEKITVVVDRSITGFGIQQR